MSVSSVGAYCNRFSQAVTSLGRSMGRWLIHKITWLCRCFGSCAKTQEAANRRFRDQGTATTTTLQPSPATAAVAAAGLMATASAAAAAESKHSFGELQPVVISGPLAHADHLALKELTVPPPKPEFLPMREPMHHSFKPQKGGGITINADRDDRLVTIIARGVLLPQPTGAMWPLYLAELRVNCGKDLALTDCPTQDRQWQIIGDPFDFQVLQRYFSPSEWSAIKTVLISMNHLLVRFGTASTSPLPLTQIASIKRVAEQYQKLSSCDFGKLERAFEVLGSVTGLNRARKTILDAMDNRDRFFKASRTVLPEVFPAAIQDIISSYFIPKSALQVGSTKPIDLNDFIGVVRRPNPFLTDREFDAEDLRFVHADSSDVKEAASDPNTVQYKEKLPDFDRSEWISNPWFLPEESDRLGRYRRFLNEFFVKFLQYGDTRSSDNQNILTKEAFNKLFDEFIAFDDGCRRRFREVERFHNLMSHFLQRLNELGE